MLSASRASASVDAARRSQHVGAVGERHGELRPLLDEEDRDAPARGSPPSASKTASTTLGARPSDGSSRSRTVGPRDESACDRELLLLAAGQDTRLAAAELRGRPGRVRRPARDPPRRSLRRRPCDQAQSQVLLDGEVAVDVTALGDERDPARAICSLGAPTIDRAVQAYVARRRGARPHDRVQRRRLARAVRADEPDDLAARNAEAEPANGGDAPVAHLEVRRPRGPDGAESGIGHSPPRLVASQVGDRDRRRSPGSPPACPPRAYGPRRARGSRSHTSRISAMLWSMSSTPAPRSSRTRRRPRRTPRPRPRGVRPPARP